jgi:hypothetical protein
MSRTGSRRLATTPTDQRKPRRRWIGLASDSSPVQHSARDCRLSRPGPELKRALPPQSEHPSLPERDLRRERPVRHHRSRTSRSLSHKQTRAGRSSEPGLRASRVPRKGRPSRARRDARRSGKGGLRGRGRSPVLPHPHGGPQSRIGRARFWIASFAALCGAARRRSHSWQWGTLSSGVSFLAEAVPGRVSRGPRGAPPGGAPGESGQD